MKKYLIKLNGLNLVNIISRLGKDNVEINNLIQKTDEEIEFEASAENIGELKRYFKNVEFSYVDLTKKNVRAKIFKSLAVYLALPIIIFYALFYSKRIYKIEINGTSLLTKKELITLLEANGVGVGEIKEKTTKEIEKILLKNEKIAQVSCYFKGTTLIINISEKLILAENEYEPILAKFDGVIYDFELQSGTLNFKVGDFVRVGDILVFPFMFDKSNNQINIKPEAKIYARIYKSYTKELPRYETFLEKTGRTKTYTQIKFKNSSVKCLSKPFVFYEETVYNKYISSILPIIKQTIVYLELEEKKKENDLVLMQSENEEATKIMAEKDNADKEILIKKTYSIIANDVLFSTTTIAYNGEITNG